MIFFHQKPSEKPPYLDRIEILEYLEIVRMKGEITHDMIPIMEARIQANRKRQGGIRIEKNILVDYALVTDVDSATIAFHLVHLKEYDARGRKVGFVNIPDELQTLMEMLKEKTIFKIYDSETDAVKELNKA